MWVLAIGIIVMVAVFGIVFFDYKSRSHTLNKWGGLKN